MQFASTDSSQRPLFYATKLYLKGVPKDAIKDILGVDERTLKYYIKAMQERKKRVLFTYMEKVSGSAKIKKETTESETINRVAVDPFVFGTSSTAR